MAVRFDQPNVRVDAGGAVNIVLPRARETRRIRSNRWTYRLYPLTGQSLTAYAPWLTVPAEIAPGPGVDPTVDPTDEQRTITGTVPASGAGFRVDWNFVFVATRYPTPEGLAPDQFRTGFQILVNVDLETTLAVIEWNDDFLLQQDTGHNRLLLMKLPPYAPQSAGIEVAGAVYLPIEGLVEMQLPTISGQGSDVLLYQEDERGEDELPVLVKGRRQVEKQFGGAALRVAWHEDYASHGGPYGLRAQAAAVLPEPPLWVYYDRGQREIREAGALIRPATGPRKIAEWTGWIDRYIERVTTTGIFVDFVLATQSRMEVINPFPGSETEAMSLAVVDAGAVTDAKGNAPTVKWSAEATRRGTGMGPG